MSKFFRKYFGNLGNNKKKITLPDGSIYEGDVVDGKKHGKCKISYKNGDVYEGDVVDDKKHGKGKYTYKNGDVYEGDYVDGKMNGKGKLTLKTGGDYEGDYVDGKKHGKGKYTWKNGDVYEGDFVESKCHGYGIKTYIYGRIEQGNWDNGVLVRQHRGRLNKYTYVPKDSATPLKLECCVCAETIRDLFIIVNCGHTKTCYNCLTKIDKCPICVKPFDLNGVKPVYI